MKIFNTMTKKKEEFVPLEEGKVKMYVCGPTVYNFIHIGNARPMIVFDTVRRYFEYKGYDVNYVSNFTDVDDKIIKKAIEEGVTADEISKRYIAECKKDMDGMNIKPATKNPLATEEICGMVDMIQTLIDKGFAYEKNGTVYYSTRKFKDYGKLSHKNLDDLRSGERSLLVSGEDEKEDPLDFVLWKPKKEGEPAWESPWSEGRPGWHIECSEMSKKYLGEQIDIHAGGEDLVFPHHENEIAQSEAANGKEFARYWMHNAFLNIDNRKMSKSLGNFRTVREISEQYDLQVLRFFMLSAHYRSPLNFSADLMEASKNGLERIVNAADNLKFLMGNAKAEAITDAEAENFAKTEEFVAGFEKAMDDDFNTADAVAAIFDLVKYINTTTDAESSKEYLQKLFDLLVKLTGVLGLIVDKKEEILDEDIEKLIEERQAARKAKDFARADAIRDELAAKGIQIKDTRTVREGYHLKGYQRRSTMEKSVEWEFDTYMQEIFQMKEVDIKEYSPLTLAYIGDCIYDLIIKTLVINEGNRQVQKLHQKTSSYVQASAQSKMMRTMQEHLTEEEHAIYKRGRNAKSVSPAKNQSITDYRRATGFEALLGYLYLKKEWKRMLELVKIGLDSIKEQ